MLGMTAQSPKQPQEELEQYHTIFNQQTKPTPPDFLII
jgi:hypothetical protein